MMYDDIDSAQHILRETVRTTHTAFTTSSRSGVQHITTVFQALQQLHQASQYTTHKHPHDQVSATLSSMDGATAALTRLRAIVTRLSTAVAALRRRVDPLHLGNQHHPLLQLTAALEEDVCNKRHVLLTLRRMCSGIEPDFTNVALHERLVASWSEMPSFAHVHHLHDVSTVVAIMEADLALLKTNRLLQSHSHSTNSPSSSRPMSPSSEKPLSPALALLKSKSCR